MADASKIVLFGNRVTTKSIYSFLLENKHEVHTLVNLDKQHKATSSVSGYLDLEYLVAGSACKIYRPQRYDLCCETDFEFFSELKPDLGLVMGWNRLIPSSILDVFRCGVFGMHGSSEPLPRGRGRSPINWSIIEGRKVFATNLFRYLPGVDDGDIVETQKFEINDFDDCSTLHLKNVIAMETILEKNIRLILDGKAQFNPQSQNIEPTFYPQRTADDGRINWSIATVQYLVRHIKAQTHPFPGAHCFLNNQKVYFWDAQPFDQILEFGSQEAGCCVRMFDSHRFIIRVWDGYVLINKWSIGAPVTNKGRIPFSAGVCFT